MLYIYIKLNYIVYVILYYVILYYVILCSVMSHSILFYSIVSYPIIYHTIFGYHSASRLVNATSKKTLLGLPTCVAVWDVAHHHLMAALPTSAVNRITQGAVNIFTKEL